MDKDRTAKKKKKQREFYYRLASLILSYLLYFLFSIVGGAKN